MSIGLDLDKLAAEHQRCVAGNSSIILRPEWREVEYRQIGLANGDAAAAVTKDSRAKVGLVTNVHIVIADGHIVCSLGNLHATYIREVRQTNLDEIVIQPCAYSIITAPST